MRVLPVLLLVLLCLIQYPLWLGKGGWFRVWELDRQVGLQQKSNDRQAQRNAALLGEVNDLKQGMQAIEERARYDLGMIRPDEIFVQYNPDGLAMPLRPKAPSSLDRAKDASSSELRTALLRPLD